MNNLESAALKLAGFTLLFLLAGFAYWWTRRPRPEAAAPGMPRAPRAPKLPRRASPEIEGAELSPERLARIKTQAQPPSLFDPEPEPEIAPPPEPAPASATDWDAPFDTAPAAPPTATIAAPTIDEAALEAIVSEIAEQVRMTDPPPARPNAGFADGQDGVRLAPQMPPRDPILRTSWIGGRPHLPAAMAWPTVDGVDGDFLAQIACGDLPPDLWDGLGPRSGSLAFFAHPDTGAATALHLVDDGAPRDPPRSAGAAYFRPWRIAGGDLGTLVIRAFPECPVDIVAQDDETGAGWGQTDAIEGLLSNDYDVADPAFHPFDWPSMAAMAAILESRLAGLPTDGIAPDDANDELTLAIADAAETNRDALVRAREILDIIGESARQGGSFSPSDATAVMAGLHAIRWTSVSTRPDEETGEDQVSARTLPLTRHSPGADLWVGAWRTVLFDHAKHAYAANPDRLPALTRGFFEPLWNAMATEEAASMGSFPARPAPGFDEERDAVLLELPASGLRSIGAATGGHLVLAIRKADLAAGDFSKLRTLVSN